MKIRSILARRLSPLQVLCFGYLASTLFVALLLMLDWITKYGEPQRFVDAFFMAASAVTTTGLGVVNVGAYSHFGQLVLLLAAQAGGLGYMTIFVFVVGFLTKKLSVTDRLIFKKSVSGDAFERLARIFYSVLKFTLVFEAFGIFCLTIFWLAEFPLPKALYLAVFHSVSAFCTTGFSLLPQSLMGYQRNGVVNLVIDAVSIAGGLGFYVIQDLYSYSKKTLDQAHPRRLRTHTKLAVFGTVALLIFGTATLFFAEKWSPSDDFGDKILASSFQTVSAATTNGHHSLDVASMSQTGLFMMFLLMFVGACSGGVGGGIKVTTLILMFTVIFARLKRQDVNFFGRKVPDDVITKAFVIFFSFLSVMVADTLILSATEKGSFLQLSFEIGAAMSNSGLSAGLTPFLSGFGKCVIVATMFVGRLGALGASLLYVRKAGQGHITYPEEDVYVG